MGKCDCGQRVRFGTVCPQSVTVGVGDKWAKATKGREYRNRLNLTGRVAIAVSLTTLYFDRTM